MAQNVEIKARLTQQQFLQMSALAHERADHQELIEQIDTFFNSTNQRLKLREFADGSAELIAYERGDQPDAKLSDYIRTPIEHPALLKESLERTIGIRGVVQKSRQLYLIGQTRVHMDRVNQLGHFVELEVVLEAEQTCQSGQTIAEDLMTEFGILPESLISHAYIDLLDSLDRQNADLSS